MRKRKEDDKIWHRIWSLLFAYKKIFPGIMACLLCTSILTFLQPLIIRSITDQGMVEKDMKCIFVFSGILFLTAVFSQIIDVVQTKLFSNMHNYLTLSLYKKAYKKIENLPIEYYAEKGSVEITNTLGADIDNVASITDQITTFSIASILQIVGGIVGLSLLDWKLALLIVFLIPIKYLTVYHFSKKKDEAFNRLIDNNRKFFVWMGDCISGIREMKLWDLFRVKNKNFESLQKNMMDSYKENLLLDQYCNLCISLLDMLLNATLYILSGLMIIRGELTIGGAFAFITYSSYVVSPISFLINIKYYFAQIKPSAKRFFDFLDWPKEEQENSQSQAQTELSLKFDSNTSVLELIHVDFAYEKDKSVLKDVNLTVLKGEKIGIIGENGSGKSTIIDLLLGFYQPDQGVIKLGGIPLNDLGIGNVRKKIAVVSQKSYFFQGTIEENVNVDGMASHEEVIAACKKSGAMDFIKKLDEGFGQVIGQNGAKLSGGERQKLAVARALLKNADILLLDEATTGFDAESVQAFNKLMFNEFKKKTVLYITHRYEELIGVSSVYELSEGKLRRV